MPDLNLDRKILDPSKADVDPDPDPDILIFKFGYPDSDSYV